MNGFLQNYSEKRLQKEAVDPLGLIKGLFSGGTKLVTDAAKLAFEAIKTGTTVGLVGAGLGGAGIGYVTAKATSPDIATETAEQDITREALETEIDVVKRQIAQLERRKAAEKRAEKKKVYDRFV